MRIYQLKSYLLLWSTQALSALGSGMTSYALVLWLYLKNGSALETALLSVCSYAPYVVMSIFAGALSDRWNKKLTMLVCDLLAAASTVAVLALIRAGSLIAWHLYILNALNGLMNTIQQPAKRGCGYHTDPEGILSENQRSALLFAVAQLDINADSGNCTVRLRRDRHGNRLRPCNLCDCICGSASFNKDTRGHGK